MLDKATVLITLFTIVDDTMKGSSMIQDALKRPGPAPHLSDSEVITLAFYQELVPVWMKRIPIRLIVGLISFRDSTANPNFLIRTPVQCSAVAH